MMALRPPSLAHDPILQKCALKPRGPPRSHVSRFRSSSVPSVCRTVPDPPLPRMRPWGLCVHRRFVRFVVFRQCVLRPCASIPAFSGMSSWRLSSAFLGVRVRASPPPRAALRAAPFGPRFGLPGTFRGRFGGLAVVGPESCRTLIENR